MKLVTKSPEETLARVRHYSETAIHCRCRVLKTVPVGWRDPDQSRAREQASKIIPLPSLDDIAVPKNRYKNLGPLFDTFLQSTAGREFNVVTAQDWFDLRGLNDIYGSLGFLLRKSLTDGAILYLGYENGKKTYCLAHDEISDIKSTDVPIVLAFSPGEPQ